MTSIDKRVEIYKEGNQYKVTAKTFIPKGTKILVCSNDYIWVNDIDRTIFNDPALDLVYKMVMNHDDRLFPREGDQFELSEQYVEIMEKTMERIVSSNKHNEKNHLKKLLNMVDYPTLIRFYAKFIFNAFMIPNGCAINIIGARLNHSCDPNVVFNARSSITNKKSNDLGVIEFVTIKDIDKGTEICNSYLQNYVPSKKWDRETRRDYLKSHYDFYCKCNKCVK